MRKPAPHYTPPEPIKPERSEADAGELCAEGVFTIDEASDFLGVCQTVVRKLIRDRKLVSFVFEGRRVIPRRDCVRILADALLAFCHQRAA